MRIELKKLRIENFKGCREKEIDFKIQTNIFGANASGKTTLLDAFLWLLFNKNSKDVEKFMVRPRDKDGNMINNIEIMVEATLDLDGETLVLKKTQKQEWVKPRGRQEQVFKGNLNEYEIDGYPKSEKEYKEYIEGIIPETLFKIVTNPDFFPNMKWKEQREVLMKLISEITDMDVVDTDERFQVLVPELDKASLDNIQAKYAKAMKGLKKTAEEIPTRIDEASRSITEIDVPKLKSEEERLLNEIKAEESKLENAGERLRGYEELSSEIMTLESKKHEIARIASEELNQEKNRIRKLMANSDNWFCAAEEQRMEAEEGIETLEREINALRKEKEALLEKYNKEKNLEFDESKLECPYCKQSLPGERQERIKSEFNEKKKRILADIIADGNSVKEKIEKKKISIGTLRLSLEGFKEDKIKANKQKNEAESEFTELPQNPDLSKNKDYQSLLSEIENKRKELDGMDTGMDYRKQLKDKIAELNSDLSNAKSQLMKEEANKKAKERIEELKAEQKENAQKMADQEKLTCILDDFIRVKMDMLSSKINNKFELVSWQLFEEQINGGMKECCKCKVGGVSYSDMNDAKKVQAGLDIINALSKMYNITAPVWIDNRESVTEIPEMNGQVINLFVSAKDKELRIEYERED